MPRLHQLVRQGVGVQNGEAHFAEHRGYRALAAGDAAGETESQHIFYRALTVDCTVALSAWPRRSLAAFTVLLMSMVMVMGPTPPGTGVSAPAVFTASGWTSPTSTEPLARNFSRRAGKLRSRDSASFASVTLLVPTSMTEAPGRIQSAPT